MASVVAEFCQITGVDIVPPTTMAELIPYLLTVFVAVVLVTAVFRLSLIHISCSTGCRPA